VKNENETAYFSEFVNQYYTPEVAKIAAPTLHHTKVTILPQSTTQYRLKYSYSISKTTIQSTASIKSAHK